MSIAKLKRLIFSSTLPSAGKGARRQIMFDQIKPFIQQISVAHQIEIEIMKTVLYVYPKDDFGLWIDSRPEFVLGCVVYKDNDTQLANELMNEVYNRVNQTDWEEKSVIDLFCLCEFTMNKKYDLFSPFTREDTLASLSKDEEKYKIRRMDIWQPPSEIKPRWAISTQHGKKSNILELVLMDQRENVLPIDAVSQMASKIQDRKKKLLIQLFGEE
jgi:hypothetical protein